MLENIRIVLCNTYHPGNIGSVARAMKNMGLKQLYLVAPQTDFPHQEATQMAAGASDLLASAVVVDELSQALADCELAIGASARTRSNALTIVDARTSGEMLAQESEHAQVALVFGKERSGLSNEQIAQCHRQVYIPCSPEYPSLNLAMAVQTLCYEVFVAHQQALNLDQHYIPKASSEEMDNLFEHLERVLKTVGFSREKHPGELMNRLRRFFRRARPERIEMNIFRGFLAAIEKKIDK